MKFPRPKKSVDQPRRRAIDDSSANTSPAPAPFRRNQTLSATRRSSEAGRERSERDIAHQLAQRRRKMIAVFGLVLAIVVVLGLLLTQFTARVTIAGSSRPLTDTIDASPYQERINEYHAVNPAERMRFLLNQGALTEFVAAAYPEVADITTAGIREIVDTQFTLTFREPIAGWQINNRQYFVDDKGVVFQNNYYTDPRVQIIDESGISPEQGTTVASTRLLSFVGLIVSGAGQGGYTVVSVNLPPDTTRQLHVRLEGEATYARVTIDREAGDQVQDMIRALDYLKERNVSAEYVDVRVAGRAVYR